MSGGRTVVTAVILIGMCAACSGSDATSDPTVPSTAVAATSTTTTIASTTTAPTTTAVAATDAPTTPAPTTAAPSPTTVAPAAGVCPTGTTIPSGATNLVAINGDIDGDTLNDVVTAYSLGGVPHVHATLATGGNSDTEVPIGNADTVSIQFMDFDHSLGAAVPPPV
ncbi:MAG TPA: hypothetical protein VGC84_15835, partial [Ilumatobacteraceae bacterium]